ncbi:MAG TPA: hypothetical protein VEH77_03585 [Roseiarcus sp.]|nr:hypothetical protein [Roseiarcus sp.]
MGSDPVCEAKRIAAYGQCETEKERRRLQCEADNAASKAACEAKMSTVQGGCEALKAGYAALTAAGSDYANVDSPDLTLSGNAAVCVSGLAFDPSSFRLTGNLGVEANARAQGHITFTPLNVLGKLTCFAPYDKALDIGVRVPSQPVEIDTTARLIDNGAEAAIDALISNPIHVRFPFGLIASSLASDPQFVIQCPIPGVASALRASTPDSWWPSAARGDLEEDIPDWKLNIDLIRKPVSVGTRQIEGVLKSDKMGIGGVFSISSRLTRN